jgi:hypothetical protein
MPTPLARTRLGKFAFRRYDYRLRVLLDGAGTGLNRLFLAHDIQCSQRALPALDQGRNTITFSAGPQEGTVTIEGSTQGGKQDKQLTPMDFHPVLKEVEEQFCVAEIERAIVPGNCAPNTDILTVSFFAHHGF